MSSNPFATADAWETSAGGQLGPGTYKVKITESEDATAKSSGKPQVQLNFDGDRGYIKDWCPYSETFMGKIVALFDAAGVDRPVDGEFDPADHYRITQRKLDQLRNKEIGIVVRDEPDYKDPTVMRSRVQGYLKASEVQEDAPIDTAGLPDPQPVSRFEDRPF